MCSILRRALIIAALAKRAVVCGESVCRGKTRTFCSMAIVASVTSCALRTAGQELENTEKSRFGKSHLDSNSTDVAMKLDLYDYYQL